MKKFYVERIGLHIVCWTYRNDERVMVSTEDVADAVNETGDVVYLPPENTDELHKEIEKAADRIFNRKFAEFRKRKRGELGLS
jgi:hypothetical protein